MEQVGQPMTLSFTILGCGSSGGVPRVGGIWGQCDPHEPKNRRRRCSLLVHRFGEKGRTSVLVDTSPDLREQLLDAHVGRVDGVVFTHDHADHTHGIDDLRVLALNSKARVKVYADGPTGESLMARFAYCFRSMPGSSYPPILEAHFITALQRFEIVGNGGAIPVLPFRQDHGEITSLGFRFGGLAYSPDVSGIPEESLPALANLDVWIIDALRWTPHPSHFSVAQALEWIGRVKPKRAVLTHLHTDLDYQTLRKRLPDHVEPAYDGMIIEGVEPL